MGLLNSGDQGRSKSREKEIRSVKYEDNQILRGNRATLASGLAKIHQNSPTESVIYVVGTLGVGMG